MAVESILDHVANVPEFPEEDHVPHAVCKLERLEPDVEGEVCDVLAQLAADVIPQVLERFGHGSATALRGSSWQLHVALGPVPFPSRMDESPRGLGEGESICRPLARAGLPRGRRKGMAQIAGKALAGARAWLAGTLPILRHSLDSNP